MSDRYDMVVVGGGPAGEKAATQAVTAAAVRGNLERMKVELIQGEGRLGKDCGHFARNTLSEEDVE